MDTKLIISGILLFLLLISGMWLSLLGRPLNTIIFSLHKIIAVAAVVLLILAVIGMKKGMELSTLQLWAVILSGVFLLLALVSGALLSFDSLENNFTRLVHKLTPSIFLVCITLTVLLLYRTD